MKWKNILMSFSYSFNQLTTKKIEIQIEVNVYTDDIYFESFLKQMKSNNLVFMY